MTNKAKRALSGVLMVLLIVGVIPTFAFAADNNTTNVSVHAGNGDVGTFAEMKARVLDMINNEIARLQGVSTNVTAASNTTDLQKALGRDKMTPRSQGMNTGGNGCNFAIGTGFNLNKIAEVNDTTFPVVKANLVNSLTNITAILQNQENTSITNNNTVRATQIENKLTVLQGLETNISQTTDATGLQNVTLVFMQGQIDDAVNKQITNLKSRTANITDANVTSNIDKRITNLQTFETSINNATSLSALQQTLANDNVFVPISDGRMGKNMMHNGGFTRQGNHC